MQCNVVASNSDTNLVPKDFFAGPRHFAEVVRGEQTDVASYKQLCQAKQGGVAHHPQPKRICQKVKLLVHVPVKGNRVDDQCVGTHDVILCWVTFCRKLWMMHGHIAKTKVLIGGSQPKPCSSAGYDASRSGPFVEAMTALYTTKTCFKFVSFLVHGNGRHSGPRGTTREPELHVAPLKRDWLCDQSHVFWSWL